MAQSEMYMGLFKQGKLIEQYGNAVRFTTRQQYDIAYQAFSILISILESKLPAPPDGCYLACDVRDVK